MLRRYAFLMLLLLFAVVMPADSQTLRKFSVASFEQDQFDTAAKGAYKKMDANGSLYAIIKVTSNNPDDNLSEYHFNFSNVRHEEVGKDGELWVYVARNAKRVTITRKGFATIKGYDLETTIQPGVVYKMQLSVTAAPVYRQMVQFNVKPSNVGAIVMIKSSKKDAQEEMFDKVDETTGVAAKSMEFGTYTYKIVANNYHISEGRITLNDKTKTYIEDVTLKPNFSEITLKVDSNADIYIDGEKKGCGTWTGILRTGNYQVECRQENHRPSSQYITVTESDNRTIELPLPIPITGTLAVVSKPYGADIKIDGKDYGVTPMNINDLIIGKHTITLSKANYKPESQTFEIRENETTDVSITLNDITKMTINSRPHGAELSIDGKRVGKTPYSAEMASGDYTIKMSHPKYHVFEQRIHLDSSHPEVSLSMKRQYQHSMSGYLQVSGQAGTMIGAGGNIGGYIGNFNIEACAVWGIEQEKLYVNYTDGTASSEEKFHGMFIGGKIGYGFILGTRMHIAPQIGMGNLLVESNLTQSNGGKISTNVLCATIGVRIEYAVTPHFGVSLTPEGCMAITKNDIFETLTSQSSKIKGWGTGANARLGLYLYL